jgi:IS1 family transposase
MCKLRKLKQMRNGASWGKKEKACTDEDKEDHGDHWDHVVMDGESKAVISIVSGKRTKENTEELIQDFASRCNDGEPPELFTTDDYSCYQDALLHVYGAWIIPELTGKRGRPKGAFQTEPEMQYATVKKERKGGRVVSIDIKQVYGTDAGLEAALESSSVSNAVNTSFVERQNGTDRHLNARKARKTLAFSKDCEYHICHSLLFVAYYNFCWDHGSLRIETGYREYTHRSPMMALGVTKHIWSVEEMATYQTIAGH